jgi:hypothetical protein
MDNVFTGFLPCPCAGPMRARTGTEGGARHGNGSVSYTDAFTPRRTTVSAVKVNSP